MRYFLLDKVTEVETGRMARGVKGITLTDQVLHDHFPDYPIYPGSLLIEGLAQLAGFLLETTFNTDDDKALVRAILVQVDKMKFHSTVGPGSLVEMDVSIDSLLEDAARVSVSATAGSDLLAKGFLSFILKHIDSAKVTEQRKNIYALWTKDLKNCPPIR